ncbi:MAG: hypothetical protein H6524_12365 [Actinobacteria bacterium]|nr:hypothetical protein [Actinomycetota bacterium]
MNKQPGVFCLETSWADDGKDLTDKTSVEQQLRMLQGAQECGDVIHRDVATMPEFTAYLVEWLRPKYMKENRQYPLAYFAFHGFNGGFWVGDTQVSLAQLAELIGAGRATGRIFYFGSCVTMQAPEKELRNFCRTTGAKAVVGYTKVVTWRESAAFDCLLVPRLLEMQKMGWVYKGLRRDYSDLVHVLGLRVATTKWATDRKIATDAAPA